MNFIKTLNVIIIKTVIWIYNSYLIGKLTWTKFFNNIIIECDRIHISANLIYGLNNLYIIIFKYERNKNNNSKNK